VNKGKVEEAKNALDNNLSPEVFNSTILLAFHCCRMPCKMNLDDLSSSSDESTDEAEQSRQISIAEFRHTAEDNDGSLRSELLSHPVWSGVVCELLHINELIPEPITQINQELKDNKADLLVQILRGRVQSFMIR
jgi:hypothetical protein